MDLQLWNSIINPYLSLLDKKWGHLTPGFWEFARDMFPKTIDRLEELEQQAWKSFNAKEGAMTLRLKITAYFDLLNKTCEQVSKHESWRSPGVARQSDGNIPF